MVLLTRFRQKAPSGHNSVGKVLASHSEDRVDRRDGTFRLTFFPSYFPTLPYPETKMLKYQFHSIQCSSAGEIRFYRLFRGRGGDILSVFGFYRMEVTSGMVAVQQVTYSNNRISGSLMTQIKPSAENFNRLLVEWWGK